MLGALSIQLGLYAVAWVLMGVAFRLARQAVVSWSLAWALLSLVTFWLTHPGLAALPGTPEAVNLVVVSAFALLLWGTVKVTQMPISSLALWTPLAGAVLIDVLRLVWIQETAMLRWVLFAACLAMQMYHIAARLAGSLKKIGFARLAVLAWSPPLLVALFFVLRAILLAMRPVEAGTAFTGATQSDQTGVAMFFVALGAFNFAKASFVIGLMAQRMRELSHTDQLTKLANRRSLMHELEREDARYRRTGRAFTLVILDVDHFKKVNDQYGHLVGDQVLRAVSSQMIREIRSSDLLARYGGEEFLLLMPETGVEAAQQMAERIRTHIMATPVHTDQGDIQITISGGVAEALDPHANFDSVISRADDALYRAKREGRNRIVVAGPVASTELNVSHG